jgi:hypothetical protein
MNDVDKISRAIARGEEVAGRDPHEFWAWVWSYNNDVVLPAGFDTESPERQEEIQLKIRCVFILKTLNTIKCNIAIGVQHFPILARKCALLHEPLSE